MILTLEANPSPKRCPPLNQRRRGKWSFTRTGTWTARVKLDKGRWLVLYRNDEGVPHIGAHDAPYGASIHGRMVSLKHVAAEVGRLTGWRGRGKAARSFDEAVELLVTADSLLPPPIRDSSEG